MKPLHVLHVPILALFGTAVFLYVRFSAEDAFITYRYAENLATLGSLVFNEGEPILALTSPLHGLVSTVLFLVTGHTVLANKILGLALLLPAATFVWLRYRDRPLLQPLVAALILLPPCVVLWTFGGLETPLLLFLVTSATLLAASPQAPGPGRLCLVFFLAGLAFLTRFDSVLFTAPLVLFTALRARAVRDVALAAAVGAALPAAWLVFSQAYYGDILPTSYYSKTPMWSLPVLIGNGKYVLFYLVLIGLLPALLLALTLMGRWRTMSGIVWHHVQRMWWLYLGIAAQLLYGLTMAQTHMMFSFRYFVPYIPAFTILVVDLMGPALDTRPWTLRRRASVLGLAVLVLLVFQGFQIHYTWRESVNGLSPWGEYRSTGVRQYIGFVETLQRQGADIREHWNTVADGAGRRPRIFTYAGGVVPYTFRNSYVYETLVSYRHCAGEEDLVEAPNVWMRSRVDLRLSADYIHILTPRHGPVAPQLPLPEEHYSVISSYQMVFDDHLETFLVFHSPTPAPHTLPATLDGLCDPRAR